MPATRSAAISGKLRDERLHRDATHRVADEHRAAQVETLHHGPHVVREVLERMPGAPDHRLTVAAVIERDRAEARPRAAPRAGGTTSRIELRDAVREHDRRARRPTRRRRSSRRRTSRAADRRTSGASSARAASPSGAAPQPPREHALPRVARARRPRPRRRPRRRRPWRPPRAPAHGEVHPRHAGPDPAHDRVRDGAHRPRPRRGGDLLVALAPDQHDLVADLDREVADVEHQLVHRDGARDRAAPAAHDRLAAVMRELAGHTVGVADRHGRDAGRARRSRSAARTTAARRAEPTFTCETRAFTDIAGRSSTPAFELVGRARSRSSRCRRAPCRSARPASRSRRRCCTRARCRSGRPRARSSASTASKLRELLGGVRVAGLVGNGEVRAHAGELELGPVDHLRRELDRLVGAAADAMHARCRPSGARRAGRARRGRRRPWRARRCRRACTRPA